MKNFLMIFCMCFCFNLVAQAKTAPQPTTVAQPVKNTLLVTTEDRKRASIEKLVNTCTFQKKDCARLKNMDKRAFNRNNSVVKKLPTKRVR